MATLVRLHVIILVGVFREEKTLRAVFGDKLVHRGSDIRHDGARHIAAEAAAHKVVLHIDDDHQFNFSLTHILPFGERSRPFLEHQRGLGIPFSQGTPTWHLPQP